MNQKSAGSVTRPRLHCTAAPSRQKMGCASGKPLTTIDAAIAQAKAEHAELRARIERAPSEEASELERILGLKEALLKAVVQERPAKVEEVTVAGEAAEPRAPTSRLSLNEQVDILREQLGVGGKVRDVLMAAAAQLGVTYVLTVPTTDEQLKKLADACMESFASKVVGSTTAALWSERDKLAEEEPPTRAESTTQFIQRLKDGLGKYPEEVWAWPEGKLYRKRIASLMAASVPKTNKSIRRAVAEFKAESRDFNSPKAESKWGPLADWDVSNVTNMDV